MKIASGFMQITVFLNLKNVGEAKVCHSKFVNCFKMSLESLKKIK